MPTYGGDPRVIFELFDLSLDADWLPGTYIAVVGQFERGPMWQGVPFTSSEGERFIQTFGDSVEWSADPLCCLAAMRGGANLLVYRIGHCTDISDRSTLDILPASVLIPDRGGSDTPGSILTGLQPFTFRQGTSGRFTGTELGPFNIVTGVNDQFSIRVKRNGVWGPPQTFTLAAGVRTAQQVCDDANALTDGISYTVESGKFHGEGNEPADDLEILAVANDAYSALGLSEGVYAHIDGTDVLVLSIDGQANQTFDLEPAHDETGQFSLTAAELGLQLTGMAGATVTAAQGRVSVVSQTTGDASSVQVKEGSTALTALGLDTALHQGTVGSVKHPWRAVMIGPGAYANGAKLFVHDSALNPGTAIEVRLVCKGSPEEYHRELSNDPTNSRYWKDFLNANSKLIQIVDEEDANPAPNNWPALTSDGYVFAGGDDGQIVMTDADWIGHEAAKTGMYATDRWQMPFIDMMLFGTSSATVFAELCAYMDNRKGRRAYMPMPVFADPQRLVAFRMGDPNYGYSHAAFDQYKCATVSGNWQMFDTRTNEKRDVPCLMTLAHSICRADAAFGHHRSPFGIEMAQQQGVLGLNYNPQETPGEADLLAKYQINSGRILRTSIENRGNEGAYLWGAWSLQCEMSALRELSCSRKEAWYEWMFYPLCQRFINRPNHPITWREVHRALDPVLRADLDQGGIYGYMLITDKDALITTDGTLKGAVLNTGYAIDHNVYRCRVLVELVRQILYFVVEMGLTRTGEPFADYATMPQLPDWAREVTSMTISNARTIVPLASDQFILEFTGYDAVYVRKLKLPGWEFEVLEHSGGAQTLAVKYLGKEKVNEFTVEAVIDAKGDARSFWNERRKLQRTRDPKKYWIDGTAILLGPDQNPAMQWHLQDACFSKVEIDEFDSEDGKKLATVKATGVLYDCVEEPL